MPVTKVTNIYKCLSIERVSLEIEWISLVCVCVYFFVPHDGERNQGKKCTGKFLVHTHLVNFV